ncbi:MAG TPA: IclR family transcriptional regulator [Clostridiales bacterium]|nr:IclR family transcriptional regulator [Clostridiales bacterium]
MKKQYSVPALEKSIAILEYLSSSEEDLTITEIHQKLDIPKATVFMILQVMEGHNLVTKSRDGRYSIGPRIYSWGLGYMTKMELRKIAHPYLEKLSKETGHTVHLGRISDNRVLFIDKVEQPSFIKFNTFIGMQSDIHCCALGKAMAAHLDPAQLDEIIAAIGLGKYTENTITNYDMFKKVLKLIRQTGYAVEDEEGEIGVRCIGSAIFNAEGEVAGAVSVTALKSNLTSDQYPYIGEKVSQTAMAVSQALGYRPKQEGGKILDYTEK